MGKNATLAYPFDHMSGKLGTDENLKYAENNNPAWDAPDGRQYAKNYKPVMVLNYNAATGKQTFQIKTKSATFMSPATRLGMAISGGANAIIATIIALRLSETSPLATIYTHFLNMQGSGIIPQDMTYRKYLTDVIYKGVKAKASVFTFGSPQGQVLVNNPWVAGGAGVDVQIQTAILFKFALYLCPAAVVVDGKSVLGAPSANSTYGEIVESPFNDGSLKKEPIEGEETEAFNISYLGSILFVDQSDENIFATDKISVHAWTTEPNA